MALAPLKEPELVKYEIKTSLVPHFCEENIFLIHCAQNWQEFELLVTIYLQQVIRGLQNVSCIGHQYQLVKLQHQIYKYRLLLERSTNVHLVQYLNCQGHAVSKLRVRLAISMKADNLTSNFYKNASIHI